ncbi:hypothetical protein HIM_03138 [Hirsutella minnesotensis 3608]|nr:hypothetical protein HIM_03138 [Hirsutella minnesotensis 3608]
MRWSLLCPLLAVVQGVSCSILHEHNDGSFSPDVVLRVKKEDLDVAGIHKVATLVNGSMPGPTIRIPEDKAVWIRVYNDMQDANLTMHWHGLAQAASPFSDGTPFASQWPIPPEHYFDYELKAEKGSAGSYYYHSHVGMQAMTATGPLIVEDTACSAPPYPVDGERIFFLQDIWQQSEESMLEDLLATPGVWPGNPQAWLVNGKGASSQCGNSTRSSCQLAVIEVEPEQTYRFRFIAGGALSMVLVGFENHNRLDVIQADASYTKPHTIDMIQIAAGQRYDALFKTKSCEDLRKIHNGKLDFYVQLDSRVRGENITNYAILRYENSCGFRKAKRLSRSHNPKRKPFEISPLLEGYLDYKLEPLSDDGEKFPVAAEVTRRVILNMQQVLNRYEVWTINNQSWSEDHKSSLPHTKAEEPYLVSLYRDRKQFLPNYDAAVANGGLDPHTQTYPARVGEVVEIVLQQISDNTIVPVEWKPGDRGFPVLPGAQTHPWHAHGAHFWDAGGGRGAWDPVTAERRLAGTRPVRRDTTIVYGDKRPSRPGTGVPIGWRVWRTRVTQPGVWMVHCHMLAHMVRGMQTVWVHGDAKDLITIPRPQVDGYLTYGGDVYGNSSHAPRVLHFHDADAQDGAVDVEVG